MTHKQRIYDNMVKLIMIKVILIKLKKQVFVNSPEYQAYIERVSNAITKARKRYRKQRCTAKK